MPTVTTYPGVFGPYSPITFTRASTATYFDSTGTLQSAAINEARLDYNPSTLAAQGFLVEEARTNSIRNNTMQGAVAGTPGTLPTNWGGTGSPANGLTRQVVGTGTESGITYIDIRYSGTTTSTSFHGLNEEPIGAIAALSGQTWTHTVYISVVGGSTANINVFDVGINEYSSVPAYLVGSSVSITPSAGALVGKRFAVVRTLTNASTASIQPFILFTYNSGVAIDITLRIGLPQLELGASATSVIPTTVAQVTRNADQASVNTLSPWYNASEGTIFCQGLTPPGLANFPAIGPALSDGTANNAIIQYVFTNGYYSGARVGGVSQGNTSITTTPTIGSQYKFATAYANNDSQSALNGTASTVDNTYTVPTANQMRINTNGTVSGNLPNSWVQRITYYPRRLSQAELQAITA